MTTNTNRLALYLRFLKMSPLKTVTAALLGTLMISATAAGLTRSAAVAQNTYPLLSVGSTGETVSQLQATLTLLGFYQDDISGTYSQSTLDAVAQFQAAAGIAADGITGPSTWQKLLPNPESVTAIAAPAAQPAPEPTSPEPTADSNPEPLGPPILRAEATGPAVTQLQKELQELGYYDGPIDGGFGEQTLAAVEQFQTDQQLFVDGVVGPSTWDALSERLDR